MAWASPFAVLLASALLGACGETHVTLLAPLAEGADAATPVDGSDAATAAPSKVEHLIHRYSFDGEGQRVLDSVGTADGSLQGGAVLDGAGHATLDGVDDYVNLPNGLVSHLTDVTLVAWLAWNGGSCWQRVFDFGSTDSGEDNVGNATTSLFATPKRCPGSGPATSFETSTSRIGSVDSDTPFPVLKA